MHLVHVLAQVLKLEILARALFAHELEVLRVAVVTHRVPVADSLRDEGAMAGGTLVRF